jgi:excisionase family DNA binding protein
LLHRDIHAYRSAEKNGERLTMFEAAKLLGVTSHTIRRLIKDRVLPAEQVMPDAPWQIRAGDLHTEAVAIALARKHRPCRNDVEGQIPMFIEDSEGGAQ